MQEDLTNALAMIASLKAARESKENSSAEKGVIIDKEEGDKAKPKVSPTLTSNEVSRYEKIFKIFKDVVYAGPEASRTSATERKEKPAQVSSTAGAAQKVREGKEKSGGELLGMLGLIAGVLAFAEDWVNTLVNGLRATLARLVKRFKTVGKAILKAAKGALKSIWNGLKSVGKSIGNAVRNGAKAAQGAITSLVDKMKNSKVLQSLKNSVKGMFTSLKGALSSVGQSLVGGAKKLIENARNIGKSTVSAIQGAAGGGAASGGGARPSGGGGGSSNKSWWQKGLDLAKKGISKGGELLGKGKELVKSGAKAVASKGRQIYTAGKEIVGKSIDWVKNTAKSKAAEFFKGAAGGGKGVARVLRGLAKVPIIGPVIEGFFMKGDLEEIAANPDISPGEKTQQAGARVVKGVTGLAGAGIGAAIGSFIPVPFLGTFLGAVSGDVAGRLLGGVLADTILKPYMPAVGQFALDRVSSGEGPENPGPAKVGPDGQLEMQDFIIQGGTVHPFSSKDSVLGMKTGGVIDKLLSERGNSMNIQQAAVFGDIRQIGMLQLQALLAIKDGIFQMVGASSMSRSATPAPTGPSKVNRTPNTLTNDYIQSMIV